MNISFPPLRNLALLAGVALISGCQTLAPTATMASFNDLYLSGEYQAAADAALQSAGGLDTKKNPELLWSLQAGTALTASGQFALSNRVFDAAEELAKEEDTEHLARKGLEKVTSTLINNNLNRYSPTVYDGVMVNTYKALNSMFLADAQNARIEFNRAADRQRRAEEHFRSKIQAQKEKLSEEQAKAEKPAEPVACNPTGRRPSKRSIRPIRSCRTGRFILISSILTPITCTGCTSCSVAMTGTTWAKPATPCVG